MQLATYLWFFKLWLHSREYETQAHSNLFARQLAVPKEDGGTRGRYEMATQLEKKEVMHKHFCFAFWFGLVWFGNNFVVLKILKTIIFLEKNNEKWRQLAQLWIKHIRMEPCGSKEQGSLSVMQEASYLTSHFQRMLPSHMSSCLLMTAIVKLRNNF